jgi:ADP-heptose:LPS heptosyltransferase
MPANQWGLENWRACIERLAALLPEFAMLLIGAAEEHEGCEQLAEAWHDRDAVINLCGLLTPRESAACLAHARLFAGHDSGPLHLAAASGVPYVGVYSARCLPGQWYPCGDQHHILYHRVSCMGCQLEECTVEQMRCIRSITVDEVVNEVVAALKMPERASELVTLSAYEGVRSERNAS